MYQFRVSKKNKKTENLEPSAETGCKPLTSELCRNCAALVMVQNIIQTHLTSQHPREICLSLSMNCSLTDPSLFSIQSLVNTSVQQDNRVHQSAPPCPCLSITQVFLVSYL